MLRRTAPVGAGDGGLAAGRPDQRREYAQRRCLAGAVGAEESEDLAVAHAQVDALHRLDLAGTPVAMAPAAVAAAAATRLECTAELRGLDDHWCRVRAI